MQWKHLPLLKNIFGITLILSFRSDIKKYLASAKSSYKKSKIKNYKNKVETGFHVSLNFV